MRVNIAAASIRAIRNIIQSGGTGDEDLLGVATRNERAVRQQREDKQ